jgi:hypothetical protein
MADIRNRKFYIITRFERLRRFCDELTPLQPWNSAAGVETSVYLYGWTCVSDGKLLSSPLWSSLASEWREVTPSLSARCRVDGQAHAAVALDLGCRL